MTSSKDHSDIREADTGQISTLRRVRRMTSNDAPVVRIEDLPDVRCASSNQKLSLDTESLDPVPLDWQQDDLAFDDPISRCMEPDCTRPRRAKRLCEICYKRYYRFIRPETTLLCCTRRCKQLQSTGKRGFCGVCFRSILKGRTPRPQPASKSNPRRKQPTKPRLSKKRKPKTVPVARSFKSARKRNGRLAMDKLTGS